jgi:N-acetylglucosamine kinase-like BadF-type ATPase
MTARKRHAATSARPGHVARKRSVVPGDEGRRGSVLVGIEAGATRTVAIAVGAHGSSPVRVERGPANLQLLDDDQLARHLRAIARALPRPASLAIGMAGARTDADRLRIRRAAARMWPGVPCYATSDLETGLEATSVAEPAHRGSGSRRAGRASARVLIVSGTGSCCLGRAPDGPAVRVGGWGHVIGDRGSGYDIVIQTLRAVVQHADRAGRWPGLGRRLLRVLRLSEPHDLVTWVQSANKSDVAALAPEVFRAAWRRDPIARDVLARAVGTLADSAITCARRVAKRGAHVEFVLAGSVLLKQPRFARHLARELRRGWAGARVSRLEREGVWGAVQLARRMTA